MLSGVVPAGVAAGGRSGMAAVVMAASRAGVRVRLPAWAAWSMAARAAGSPVCGGTVSRSVRPALAVAVSSPAGMVSNQPSRTTRLPAGPSARRRRGRPASQPALPSMIRVIGPCRSSMARISPGSSAAGSADRGHQPPSSSVRADRSGCSRSRGRDGGAGMVAVWRSSVVSMVVAPSCRAPLAARRAWPGRAADRGGCGGWPAATG